MKKWLFGWLCAICWVFGGGLPPVVEQFWGNVALSPGVGVGRTPSQVLQEGCGTPPELASALQEQLQSLGVPSRLCSGIVSLRAEQRRSWTRQDWRAWADIFGQCTNDSECILHWLIIKGSLTPDYGEREQPEENHGWHHLFPALITANRLADDLRTAYPEENIRQMLAHL
ncbi:MAG: transglutaminase domain-containing protein, partial [Victivallales bacterium]|nr:transglutaminase domain-containing protein [Victivallales bacterium]